MCDEGRVSLTEAVCILQGRRLTGQWLSVSLRVNAFVAANLWEFSRGVRPTLVVVVGAGVNPATVGMTKSEPVCHSTVKRDAPDFLTL
jgi:hypothetical protein